MESQLESHERLPTLLERRPLIDHESNDQKRRSELPEEFKDMSPFGADMPTSSERESDCVSIRCFSRALPYALIFCITAAVALALLPGWPTPGCDGRALQSCDCPVVAYWCVELAALFAGMAAAFLLDHQAKMSNRSHVRSAACYAIANWIAGMTTVVAPNIGDQRCFAAGRSSRETLVAITFGLRSLFWLLGQLWMQQLVLSRVRALEAASFRPLGGTLMRNCMCCQLGSLTLMCFFMPYVPRDCMKGRWFAQIYSEPLKSLPSVLAAGSIVTSTVFSFAVSYLAVKSLAAVVAALQDARIRACTASSHAHKDLSQALSTALRQLAGVVSCFLMSAFVWTAFATWSASPSPGTEVLNTISQSLDTIAHAVAAVFLSGGHIAKTPSIVRRLNEGTGHCQQQTLADFCCPGHEQTDMGELWNAKVKDLAHRAITLEVLLKFYRRLGKDLMPHFSPQLHSTHDVVRQAIIPLSKASRSDCAWVLMEGKRLHPDCMVTHAWSNVFRDLIACIVAHVLQESSYDFVLKLLDEDVSILEQMLRQAGKLDYACWICAFAVNQHAGVCASPPSVPDPVSGLRHEACDCGLPKFFNSDGVLAHDGQSIECEMNKFDDVMVLLSKYNKNLVQCIAVDADFEVFSRAWCIAEVVAASRIGIKASLVVPSRQKLLEHTALLLRLQVQDMKASFPQDKDMILARILNKAAFNRQLQKLIFDRQSGLLAVWHHLDTEQQMSLVGRLLLWHGADDGTGFLWHHWHSEV